MKKVDRDLLSEVMWEVDRYMGMRERYAYEIWKVSDLQGTLISCLNNWDRLRFREEEQCD